ncbi:acetyltransferase, GNAT family [Dehalococcoides mccartyi 195]|uniref:Acetyltransferase, GNAT family n=2 Tax=Dehalococcoides mccartyi TaxID=61435 RepID=Q3Z7T8_DEHM1|nr:acetyltransferase, GNAT family [Dehalococcoides mccartyi 195]
MIMYQVCLVADENILKMVFDLRYRVFVTEQGIDPDTEYDQHDKSARHLVIHDGERALACCRIRLLDKNLAKIERVAVDRDHRKFGLGRKIMEYAAELLKTEQADRVVVHAQTSAAGFYASLGYTSQGDTFMEDGIEHIQMYLRL